MAVILRIAGGAQSHREHASVRRAREAHHAVTAAAQRYVAYNGEVDACGASRMRVEGEEYVVLNGDVPPFRFHV
jgi:ribosome-binding ATPase YchF (GTP1/OBG family)